MESVVEIPIHRNKLKGKETEQIGKLVKEDSWTRPYFEKGTLDYEDVCSFVERRYGLPRDRDQPAPA